MAVVGVGALEDVFEHHDFAFEVGRERWAGEGEFVGKGDELVAGEEGWVFLDDLGEGACCEVCDGDVDQAGDEGLVE